MAKAIGAVLTIIMVVLNTLAMAQSPMFPACVLVANTVIFTLSLVASVTLD